MPPILFSLSFLLSYKNSMKTIYIKILTVIILSTTFLTQVQAIQVKVTERVPWANCSWSQGNYTCNIPSWFSSVLGIFWEMIKYLTFIALLWAVLFIVINGIMYSMSGMDDGLKTAAKDRIKKTLLWLVLLLMSGWILNTLAPWVYR